MPLAVAKANNQAASPTKKTGKATSKLKEKTESSLEQETDQKPEEKPKKLSRLRKATEQVLYKAQLQDHKTSMQLAHILRSCLYSM